MVPLFPLNDVLRTAMAIATLSIETLADDADTKFILNFKCIFRYCINKLYFFFYWNFS